MVADGFFAPEPDELPESLPRDPLPTLEIWLADAAQRSSLPNPNAMCLATADERGYPSARTVLCKALIVDPGYLIFYSSFSSRKGAELKLNPRAAAVFHWDSLGRQARVEGPVLRSPEAESDAYFATRTWRSRLGAAASAQSRPIESRRAMQARVRAKAAELGVPDLDALPREGDPAVHIPRPADWGGYRLWIERIELWVAGAARVHDRARWERPLKPSASAGFEPGPWSAGRLQP